ncbi:hypothetical protein LZ31DRAFT_215880 [Colletotrichum somersetense]|nr:hypothetical protein LZ31DRAFT_215880 [Colletotrichum somersetense]
MCPMFSSDSMSTDHGPDSSQRILAPSVFSPGTFRYIHICLVYFAQSFPSVLLFFFFFFSFILFFPTWPQKPCLRKFCPARPGPDVPTFPPGARLPRVQIHREWTVADAVP